MWRPRSLHRGLVRLLASASSIPKEALVVRPPPGTVPQNDALDRLPPKTSAGSETTLVSPQPLGRAAKQLQRSRKRLAALHEAADAAEKAPDDRLAAFARRFPETARQVCFTGEDPVEAPLLAKMRRLAAAGNIEKTFEIARAAAPSVRMYTLAIKACARARDVDAAFRVYEHMKRVGVAPTQHTFTTLASACARSGDAKRARAVFAHMQRDVCAPDAVALGVMAAQCVPEANVERALQLFGQRAASGAVDARAFNSLLRVCAHREDHYGLVFETLERMVRAGYEPDGDTFETLLLATAKNGDGGRAVAVWNALVALKSAEPRHVSAMLRALAQTLRRKYAARLQRQHPGGAPASLGQFAVGPFGALVPSGEVGGAGEVGASGEACASGASGKVGAAAEVGESIGNVAGSLTLAPWPETARADYAVAAMRQILSASGLGGLLDQSGAAPEHLPKAEMTRIADQAINLLASSGAREHRDAALALAERVYPWLGVPASWTAARRVWELCCEDRRLTSTRAEDVWALLRRWDADAEAALGSASQAEREAARDAAGRGRDAWQRLFAKGSSAFARIGQLDRALDLLREHAGFRHPQYLAPLHFRNVRALVRRVADARDDGNLEPARLLSELMPAPPRRTPLDDVTERLAQLRGGGARATWWGWRAIGASSRSSCSGRPSRRNPAVTRRDRSMSVATILSLKPPKRSSPRRRSAPT